MKKVKQGNNTAERLERWRTIAIVFIVLFIIESVLFVWIIYVGLEAQSADNYCVMSCQDIEDCISYHYDYYTSICTHIGSDLEILDSFEVG